MRKTTILLAAAILAGFPLGGFAGTIVLNTAANFSILAGSTVTNTGGTAVTGGDIGVGPGSAITGFPPGTLVPPGVEHLGDAVALQAQSDLTTAYNQAMGLAPTQTLTGQDLGGLTLFPGVYFFASTAQLTGTLTLNDLGDPTAQFVFQVGSGLTTASGSAVLTINPGPLPGSNVFWQIGTSAVLGSDTAFEGHILADASITLDTGASLLNGSALARSGAVTLDDNAVSNATVTAGGPTGGGPTGGSTVPLPASLSGGLVMFTMLAGGLMVKKVRTRRTPLPVNRSGIAAFAERRYS